MALFSNERTMRFSDATKLLVADHEKAERLFADIEGTTSVAERQSLCAQLDFELTRHTNIEERILYPFIRQNVSDGQRMIDEAVKEHDEARALLERLATADASTDMFMSTLRELKGAVQHHVQDEESEVFPTFEAQASADAMARLRTQLEEAKREEAPAPDVPRPTRPNRSGSRRSSGPASRRRDGASVWVQPHHTQDGKWQVRRDRATRASRVFDTQAEAEQFGRKVAKRERVEFVLAGRDGAIREKDSYGNDPSSSPG